MYNEVCDLGAPGPRMQSAAEQHAPNHDSHWSGFRWRDFHWFHYDTLTDWSQFSVCIFYSAGAVLLDCTLRVWEVECFYSPLFSTSVWFVDAFP